jgi:glycosyltransferase involved in cell wall biosynthesis
MRVLQATPYLYPTAAYGGTPRVVHGICTALARSGFEVEVLTTDAFAAERRRSAGDDFGLAYPVHVLRNPSNALAHRYRLFWPGGAGRWARRHLGRFDLVHLHELRTGLSIALGRACRRHGRPYVLSGHGGFPHHGQRRWAKGLLDSTVLPGLVGGAAALVVASTFEREQLRAFGIAASRIEIIPHGFELGEFDRPIEAGWLRRRLGLGPQPLLLFLGRVDPIKGLELLLQAFQRVRGARPDCSLVLAGPGAVPAGTSITDRVVRLGPLEDRERLAALADADLLCFPAATESFGLVPFEALLCGTPVVARRAGGSGEWLQRIGGARLVDGTERELAEAILEVLEAPDAARSGARAAAGRIRQQFAWDHVIGGYRDLYARVLQQAPGAGRRASP